ncbi:MAG: membrane-bound lytic murein transglycosylase MltF [Proteobacteria bacterium]|nr:membrane-bound lytic murein transglycosylase MltF [Pseudomonadota bacterium]
MRRIALIAAGIALLVAACGGWKRSPALPQIRARGELRVVTLNLPTCYYLGAHGTAGLEYALASGYAARLRVRLTMYPVADEHAMQRELAAGRADVAACSLTSSREWNAAGEAARPYASIPQLVVYQRGKNRPRDTLQLEHARLAVRAGSPQEAILQKLKRTVAPTLHWQQTAPSSADPVDDVDNAEAQYAITDAREFSFSHHLYPDVQVGFALPQERPVQWIVRKGTSDLVADVNAYFHDLAASGRLAQLMADTSGDTRAFAYEESREFQQNLNDRLPRYRGWFEQAGERVGVDWRLLAAIGYQESKWNPQAVSPDGAQGVMMLTADTAAAMGIKDRADPQQSIAAGARYFAQVHDMIPERIPEPDRTWLTLAAYNAGFGHLEDARVITQSQGKNPDAWADVRERLPLLAQERWYGHARRGYARGWEPVQFVDRIQRYLKLLEWQPGEGAHPAGNPSVAANAATGANALPASTPPAAVKLSAAVGKTPAAAPRNPPSELRQTHPPGG